MSERRRLHAGTGGTHAFILAYASVIQCLAKLCVLCTLDELCGSDFCFQVNETAFECDCPDRFYGDSCEIGKTT